MIAEQARMYCKRDYDLPFLIDMIGLHIPVLLLERTRMQDQACRAVIGACTHFVAHKNAPSRRRVRRGFHPSFALRLLRRCGDLPFVQWPHSCNDFAANTHR